MEKTLPREVRLLAGIKEALEAAPDHRLSTDDLIDALCADREAGWSEANRSKRITPAWLREALKGLGMDPKGSLDWYEGPAGPGRQHISGYGLHQFRNSFLRYLPTHPKMSGSSGASGSEAAKAAETAEFPAPDDAPDARESATHRVHHQVQENPSETKDVWDTAPYAPDEPDPRRGVGEKEKKAGAGGDEDPFAWVDEQPARVSLIITKAQKRDLYSLGYSAAMVREMTPAHAHQLLGLAGPDEPINSASVIIRQHLEKPGSFVLVTMIEGRPHYTFEDGTPLAITPEEFPQLELEPVANESLLDGPAQRFVLPQQEPPAGSAAEPAAEAASTPAPEKPTAGASATNGPAAPPAVERGGRRPMRTDMVRDAVLAYAREHPEWSAKDISKVVPRPASAIQRILDAALRDIPPEGRA